MDDNKRFGPGCGKRSERGGVAKSSGLCGSGHRAVWCGILLAAVLPCHAVADIVKQVAKPFGAAANTAIYAEGVPSGMPGLDTIVVREMSDRESAAIQGGSRLSAAVHQGAAVEARRRYAAVVSRDGVPTGLAGAGSSGGLAQAAGNNRRMQSDDPDFPYALVLAVLALVGLVPVARRSG